MRKLLILEAQAKAAFSATSATEGGHETLPYIPGARLLGYAATKLYTDLQGRAFDAFHSGHIRFGGGMPLTAMNAMAFPMPQCWYERKREKGGVGKDLMIARANVLNYQLDRFTEQAEALKSGFVAADGSVFLPQQAYRAMTAIAPGSIKAATGQLFGISHNKAGLRYAAIIEADEGFEDLLIKIIEVFTTGGPVKLGRSRHSEFGGRYVCSAQDLNKLPWQANPLGEDTKELTLWCLSDLALIDALSGAPVTHPGPEHLGLPKGYLTREKSFISTRRYSPFNSYLRGPDMERAVIAAGSVLHFKFDDPLQESDLDVLARGIGLYREAGLGRVWPAPPCLADRNPEFVENTASFELPAARSVIEWPAGVGDAERMETWALDLEANAEKRLGIRALAKEWLAELGGNIKVLRSQGARPPTAAQWSEVRMVCDKPGADLKKQLRDEKTGLCRDKKAGKGIIDAWNEQAPFGENGGYSTLGKWIGKKLDHAAAQKLKAADILKIVADEMYRDAKKTEGGYGG